MISSFYTKDICKEFCLSTVRAFIYFNISAIVDYHFEKIDLFGSYFTV